jgi:hypothetical protein
MGVFKFYPQEGERPFLGFEVCFRPTYLSTYLPTYALSHLRYRGLLAYLPTYLSMPFLMCGMYRPTYLSIYLPMPILMCDIYRPTYLSIYLPMPFLMRHICRPTYLSTYLCLFSFVVYIELLTYLPTYLPMPFLMCGIHRPTYLSIYLPTYALSHVWYVWDSGFFIIIRPTATEFYVPRPPNSLKPQGEDIPKISGPPPQV